jgi:hypothetical protein
MYANGRFERLMAQAPGTFFLTDYLLGSFDHLVIERLGLDRHPELAGDYFGNYTRVVYLAQHPTPERLQQAHAAAARLSLPLEVEAVGYGALETRLVEMMSR